MVSNSFIINSHLEVIMQNVSLPVNYAAQGILNAIFLLVYTK